MSADRPPRAPPPPDGMGDAITGFWLLKTEPDEYSFDDLLRDGATAWDGVRNATAQMHLRAMAAGDACVIYHTGEERRAVGLARVERAPYPDPADPTGKAVLVDVRAGERLARPVSLEQLKALPIFAESPLLRIGRLSVVPLTAEQLAALRQAAGG